MILNQQEIPASRVKYFSAPAPKPFFIGVQLRERRRERKCPDNINARLKKSRLSSTTPSLLISFFLLLEKVVGGSSRHVRLSSTWGRIELDKNLAGKISTDSSTCSPPSYLFHLFVDFQDGSLVSASVTVIWGAENCHDILLVRPVVS